MNNLNIKKTGYALGIISVVFFLACSVWGVFLPAPELKELHFNFLRIAFPGFSFTVLGYIAGIIEAFVYGWFAGVFFAWICKKICAGKNAK